MVKPRRSIHATTPEREISDQEDELVLENSEDTSFDNSDPLLDVEESATSTDRNFETHLQFTKTYSVPPSPKRIKETIACTPTPSDAPKSNKYLLWLFPAMIAFSAIYFISPKEKNCSFENLQARYPSENTLLWKRLKVGIELILNDRTQKPGVYLFAHHGGQHVFQLIKDIAAHSSGCFGREMIPVQMESSDFISAPDVGNDFGYAIQKYRNKVREGNVILIANLNEIPAEAARALHFICDTYSPIVKNVVIFLTITIQTNRSGNADAIAEEALTELWGSVLGRNELDPLITRVTDEVIILQS